MFFPQRGMKYNLFYKDMCLPSAEEPRRNPSNGTNRKSWLKQQKSNRNLLFISDILAALSWLKSNWNLVFNFVDLDDENAKYKIIFF